MEPAANGLYYKIQKEGTGEKPVYGKTIGVKYSAHLLNGTELDSPSGKDPVMFKIGRGEMIKGFEEGVKMMKAGGKSTFLVPSALGFLSMPHTPVVFEIELVAVN